MTLDPKTGRSPLPSPSPVVVPRQWPALDAPLELRGVTRRFGGHVAVDRVTCQIRPGTITGLIGPNGAGKTTLFNLIAGALPPSDGRIVLGGRRLDGQPPHRVLRAGVARTFQIPRPFAAMTVLENLMLAGQDQRGERFWANWVTPGAVAAGERALRERARELLEWVGLSDLAGSPARILSGGQRKLLELARALMTHPRLLLLDEPAAGVNPALVESIAERIVALHGAGMTILLVEHNLDLVMRLCRPVLVMAGGRLLLEGDPATVRADPRVIDAYLGSGRPWDTAGDPRPPADARGAGRPAPRRPSDAAADQRPPAAGAGGTFLPGQGAGA